MATFACVLSLILKAEAQRFTCMYLLIYWVKWMTCWVKSHVWVIKCSRFTERIQMAQCGQLQQKCIHHSLKILRFETLRFYFCWMTADRIFIDWRFWGLTPPTKPWMSQRKAKLMVGEGDQNIYKKLIYLKYLTLHVVVGDILLCLIWRLCSCDVAVLHRHESLSFTVKKTGLIFHHSTILFIFILIEKDHYRWQIKDQMLLLPHHCMEITEN